MVTVGGGAASRLSDNVFRCTPVVRPDREAPGGAAAMGALLLAAAASARLPDQIVAGAARGACRRHRHHRTAGRRRDGDRPGRPDGSRIGLVADRIPGDVPVLLTRDSYDEEAPCWSMRLEPDRAGQRIAAAARRRVRVSQVLIGLCAVVAMTAIGGVAIHVHRHRNHEAPVVPTVAPLRHPAHRLAPSPVPPPPTVVHPPPSAVPAPSTVLPPPTAVTLRRPRPRPSLTPHPAGDHHHDVRRHPPATTTTPPPAASTDAAAPNIHPPPPPARRPPRRRCRWLPSGYTYR